MHRHVWGVRDQVTCFIEQCAGEVQALFDVHRRRGVRQRDAHLFGDGHEQIVEHFEQHRIGLRTDGVFTPQRLHPSQDQMIERRDFGLPTRLDHDGRVAFANDRGSLHLRARE